MASEMAVSTEAMGHRESRRVSARPVDLVHLSRYTLGDRALEREVEARSYIGILLADR